jgi:hypothetical protein
VAGTSPFLGGQGPTGPTPVWRLNDPL